MDRNSDEIVQAKALRPSEVEAILVANQHWRESHWRLINVDIEGLDEKILRDCDLSRLKPDVIAIEQFVPKTVPVWEKVTYLSTCSVTTYMSESAFSLQSICGPTLIFLRKASRISQEKKV